MVCSNAWIPLANSFLRLRHFTKFHSACHLQASLAIIINIYGYNHRSVADTLNNMGGVRYAQKNWESAFETYQQALDIANSVLGDKHPDVAATLRYAFISSWSVLREFRLFLKSLSAHIPQSLGRGQPGS
jgi:tetratricopeptide (TPR) repeat protein